MNAPLPDPQVAPAMATAAAHDAAELSSLVNRLAQELSAARRALAAVNHKLGTTDRTLESRMQEISEARAAQALLMATLESTTDGVLAIGQDGRLHHNTRFAEMWHIPASSLGKLNSGALLAMQLSQVKDPGRFLAQVEKSQAHPNTPHFYVIELSDGRIYESQVIPQRVQGKRVGVVTTFHDVTDRERLARLLSVLEARLPREVAEAKATVW